MPGGVSPTLILPFANQLCDPPPMPVLMLQHASEGFGRLVRARQAGDFHLRLTRYAPALHLPAHRHPAAYFCLVVRGEMEERCGSARRRFDPGSLHFHALGEEHAAQVGERGLTCLSIIPKGVLAERADRVDSSVPQTLAPLAGRCYQAFSDASGASDLLLEATALELLAGAVTKGDTPRLPERAPRWIATVEEYLHAHYADRVALSDLARIAGVHRVHVVRAFRKHLGIPPGEYVRRLQIEAARSALIATETRLADIAQDAGFSSQSHFTRAFHRATGFSPGAYRRRYTSKSP
jgi:AraC family transcriptional regulator